MITFDSVVPSTRTPRFRTALSSILLATAILPTVAKADYSTTVSPGTNWGTWEGWGCSLAWWAAIFGQRDDLADIFFTTKSTVYSGQTLPGLGLNITRYNLGASTWTSANGQKMVVSPNINPTRQIEGFWVNSTSSSPTSSVVSFK